MQIRYRKRESLPKLAWCARLRAGDDTVWVDHGPWVETRADHFFEGAWDGPLAEGRLDEAATLSGSGARLADRGVVFASPSNKIEPLHWIGMESELLVSNSLVFVLTQAGDELNPTCPYYFTHFIRRLGMAADVPKSIPTRSGRPVHLIDYGNLLVTPDLSVARREKSRPARPSDYPSYVSGLRRTVRALLDNAASPERLRPYRPVVQLSSGYDSPAVAVLVRDAGGHETVTFSRSNGKRTRDDGLAIAELLGLTCSEYDRFAYRSHRGLPEAEFCAAGYLGAQVPLATMEEQLRGSVLCTGHGGDRVWCERSSNVNVAGPNLSFPDAIDLSGASLQEFRLRVGFLHFPVPYIGMIHATAIRAIAQSSEMEAWSIGGNYDRPIQRRLVEEAGVPRHLFGQQKRASGNYRICKIRGMTAVSQTNYRAFCVGLRKRTPKLRWLRARVKHALGKRLHKTLRFSARHRLPAFGIGLLPTMNYQHFDIRRRWAIHFTMHWGQERIRHRYLEGEPQKKRRHDVA
jgi:hypothetical protein